MALALVLWVLGQTAAAATLLGDVVGLHDGDTLTVLDDRKTQHIVRLAGIDAPEKRQAFGEKARQSLTALVFREPVLVHWTKVDRYGRKVGKVVVKGQDVNRAQVAAGMAWHFQQFQKEQSAADRSAYSAAEAAARAAGLGLWRDAHPVPPWEFRRRGS